MDGMNDLFPENIVTQFTVQNNQKEEGTFINEIRVQAQQNSWFWVPALFNSNYLYKLALETFGNSLGTISKSREHHLFVTSYYKLLNCSLRIYYTLFHISISTVNIKVLYSTYERLILIAYFDALMVLPYTNDFRVLALGISNCHWCRIQSALKILHSSPILESLITLLVFIQKSLKWEERHL